MYKLYNKCLLSHNNLITCHFINLNRQCSFKSDISLDKLYPTSKLSIYTPPAPKQNEEKFSGYIPIDELKITYSRSSGPGGQNVNCVNTKVDLRFNISAATFISQTIKNNILDKYKHQINKEGFFVLKSDTTRSQQMNLADALEKLRNIIRESEVVKSAEPTLETIEKIRKKQEKNARIRLQMKRERSTVKLDRQGL